MTVSPEPPAISIATSPLRALHVVGPAESAVVPASHPSTRIVTLPDSVADPATGEAAGVASGDASGVASLSWAAPPSREPTETARSKATTIMSDETDAHPRSSETIHPRAIPPGTLNDAPYWLYRSRVRAVRSDYVS